jgi:hypothetical protein
MMAEGHRQRRREASLIAPSTPAKSIKAGIIKTVAPRSAPRYSPIAFAMGEDEGAEGGGGAARQRGKR